MSYVSAWLHRLRDNVNHATTAKKIGQLGVYPDMQSCKPDTNRCKNAGCVRDDMYSAVKSLEAELEVVLIADGDCCVVRSSGLREANLPEVEISACPLRFKDVATNLVRQIAINGRHAPESLADGKTIGARFSRPDQVLIEAFRFDRVEVDPPVLRVLDVEDTAGVFPSRLVATHLCATASGSKRDSLRLLLVAIEVYPKQKVASNAALGDFEFNPNNFWSWIDLGARLSEVGKIEDAIASWKTAACMWPRGGKLYAARMIKRGKPTFLSAASKRTLYSFWRSVTNDAIKGWCTELAVELPEVALAD